MPIYQHSIIFSDLSLTPIGGWYPGGVKYRAAYAANNGNNDDIMTTMMTPRMMMWMKARCGSDWFQHSATYRWLHCSLIIIITMMMMMIKDASTIFCIYFISYDLNMIQSHDLQLLDFPH